MSKANTIEVAALIAAIDKDGRVDPTRYEAERLILENKRIGGIEAEALTRAIPSSVAFETDRERLLETINQRLDTPLEQKRFAEALDTANISDGFVERKLEQVGGVIGDAYDGAKGWGDKFLNSVDDSVTKKMSWAYQHAQDVENNPNATALQKESAVLARDTVGKAQQVYGQSTGATVHGLEMLNDFVDLGKMGYRFSTDENYRDLLIGTAKLYAAETVDDPSKPVRDLRNAATHALENWEKEYKEAKAEGRERQFLGQTEGAVGVELAATLIPVPKMGKFGKVASSLDRMGAEGLEEAAELASDSSRALSRGSEAVTPHVGESIAEATVRSARAAEAAGDVLRAEIRLFRDEGKLGQLIEAAHKTDNIEGFLRSGELAPRELSEMLKRDPSMFAGKVKFTEALDISTKGAALTGLTTKQLGDIGEAIHTYDLVKAGHTDIVAVKNASGHGIDVVSRNLAGELEFSEIKSSAQGQAKGQRGDPEEFITSRLRQAIREQGHWAEHNTMPGMSDLARDLRREIMVPDSDMLLPGLNAKWVQMNLSKSPGSTKLDVDKTVEDWVKPEPKKQSMLESLSPDDQAFHRLATMKGKEKGLDDERADNLAAQGLLAFKQDKVVKNADDIGIYGDRLFITSFPFGKDKEPNFHVSVEVASASQKPAEETLQQVVKLDQQQAQEKIAQQTKEPDGPDGPKGPTSGPRIV
jgi:hypothetical protein